MTSVPIEAADKQNDSLLQTLGPPTMMPYLDIPVIINSYNRLASLRRLVRWLQDSGHRRIIVIDNASTYAPLLSYLKEISGNHHIQVVYLPNNYGSRAVWDAGLLGHLQIRSEYIYTDPDVVPAAACPRDLVRSLQHILKAEPMVTKIGLGLQIDDIPQHYRFCADVLSWEHQFWLRPVGRGLYRAAVDTTFALYRPGSDRTLASTNIRTGWPCLGVHESWYTDSSCPTEEEKFYAQTAMAVTSTWSVNKLPEWQVTESERLSASRPLLLNIGDNPVSMPAFLSVNLAAIAEPDGPLYIDATRRYKLDLADESVDGAYGCLSFDNIHLVEALLAELHRVVKLDAKLILRIMCDKFGQLPQSLCIAVYSALFRVSHVSNLYYSYAQRWSLVKLISVESQEFAGLPVSHAFPHVARMSDDAAEVIIHMRPYKPGRSKPADIDRRIVVQYLNNPIDMSIDFSDSGFTDH